jgi:hypothetical protein
MPGVTPILVERQVFYWFEPDFTTDVPYETYADGHPVYIEETDRNGVLYGFPMIDGPDGGLKLAFTGRTSALAPRRPSTGRFTRTRWTPCGAGPSSCSRT